MTQFPRVTLGLTVAGLLAASAALASPRPEQSSQSPAPAQQTQPPTTQQPAPTQPGPTAPAGQDPSKTQTPPQPTPPQPAPSAQTQTPQNQPVQQQDTVHPKNSKDDVDAIGKRNVGKGPNFYSLEKEIALGKGLAQEVERTSKMIDDPVVTEYVNRVGQNLVRNSDARVPFTIKVLDNEEVNAFALPGGFFYVDSGLILAADNEAELAGVMAHEIAHVAARHATKNMTRAQIWNFASVPLIFVGGPVAYAVAEAAGLLVPLGFLKFSRDAEREADLLGLEYDYASGYDPQAFVQFFEKLNVEKKKPNMVAKAFAPHPINVERIEAAQDEIRKYLPDRPEYIVDTSEFEGVKARLMTWENGRRLHGGKEEPGRPVLLKRASTAD